MRCMLRATRAHSAAAPFSSAFSTEQGGAAVMQGAGCAAGTNSLAEGLGRKSFARSRSLAAQDPFPAAPSAPPAFAFGWRGGFFHSASA